MPQSPHTTVVPRVDPPVGTRQRPLRFFCVWPRFGASQLEACGVVVKVRLVEGLVKGEREVAGRCQCLIDEYIVNEYGRYLIRKGEWCNMLPRIEQSCSESTNRGFILMRVVVNGEVE